MTEIKIDADDLYLLCDLFYLPFEHGSRGLKLLNEFNWLKANAYVLLEMKNKKKSNSNSITNVNAMATGTTTSTFNNNNNNTNNKNVINSSNNNIMTTEEAGNTPLSNINIPTSSDCGHNNTGAGSLNIKPVVDHHHNNLLPKPEVAEWLQRAEYFSTLCKSVEDLLRKVATCANKEICHDLFSYVWDITGALALLNAFVKWLRLGHFPSNVYSYTQGTYTCRSHKRINVINH